MNSALKDFVPNTDRCVTSKALMWTFQELLKYLSLAANYFRESCCCVFARKSILLVKIRVDQNTLINFLQNSLNL